MSATYSIVATKNSNVYLLASFKYARPAQGRLAAIKSNLTHLRGGTVELIEGTKINRRNGKFVKLSDAKSFKASLTDRQRKAVKGLF